MVPSDSLGPDAVTFSDLDLSDAAPLLEYGEAAFDHVAVAEVLPDRRDGDHPGQAASKPQRVDSIPGSIAGQE